MVDMTPDEAEVMEHHGDYWMELLTRQVALAYGPVLDPDGVWGLAILDLEDEADARPLGDGDPAVTSGVCTYSLLPLRLTRPDS